MFSPHPSTSVQQLLTVYLSNTSRTFTLFLYKLWHNSKQMYIIKTRNIIQNETSFTINYFQEHILFECHYTHDVRRMI
jgi:hypothetical protein